MQFIMFLVSPYWWHNMKLNGTQKAKPQKLWKLSINQSYLSYVILLKGISKVKPFNLE
jgi:hypothetical protein